MENYARNLPKELKIRILINLPYEDVMFITDHYFWTRYWENYNYNFKTPTDTSDGIFKPSSEQEYALRLIQLGMNIFIDSSAGTGKSALIKHYYLKNQANQVIGLTSTTRISALNIGGSTLHSFLGIGLGKEDVEDLYDKIIRTLSGLFIRRFNFDVIQAHPEALRFIFEQEE